jgi:hypothetical protein
VGETLLYNSVKIAPQVKAPIMIVAAENDSVNPPEQAERPYDALSCHKAWYTQKGDWYYDLYSMPYFEEVAQQHLAWFDSNSTHDCCRSYSRAGFPMRRRQLFAFAS